MSSTAESPPTPSPSPSAADRVSPSLLEDVRRERAALAQRCARGSVKRKVTDAMSTLDDLASDGLVSSHAFNVMSKSLMAVHEGYLTSAKVQRHRVAVEFAAASPCVLRHAPADIQCNRVDFVQKMLKCKLRQNAEALRSVKDADVREAATQHIDAEMQEWVDDTVEYFITPEGCRSGLLTLLHADVDVFAEPSYNFIRQKMPNVCACEFFDSSYNLATYVAKIAPCFAPWVHKCKSN